MPTAPAELVAALAPVAVGAWVFLGSRGMFSWLGAGASLGLIAVVVGLGLIKSLVAVGRGDSVEPRPVDRVLVLLGSGSEDLARVEAALDRADYGEARRHLSTLRARLDETRSVYVERRARPRAELRADR